MRKFNKDFSHFVSTFATSNVNYYLRVGPLSDLMQRNSLTCTESSGDSTCPTLCNWKICVNYTLPSNQRYLGVISFSVRSWLSNGPLMIHLKFYLTTISFSSSYYMVNIIITFIYYINDFSSVVIWWYKYIVR